MVASDSEPEGEPKSPSQKKKAHGSNLKWATLLLLPLLLPLCIYTMNLQWGVISALVITALSFLRVGGEISTQNMGIGGAGMFVAGVAFSILSTMSPPENPDA